MEKMRSTVDNNGMSPQRTIAKGNKITPKNPVEISNSSAKSEHMNTNSHSKIEGDSSTPTPADPTTQAKNNIVPQLDGNSSTTIESNKNALPQVYGNITTHVHSDNNTPSTIEDSSNKPTDTVIQGNLNTLSTIEDRSKTPTDTVIQDNINTPSTIDDRSKTPTYTVLQGNTNTPLKLEGNSKTPTPMDTACGSKVITRGTTTSQVDKKQENHLNLNRPKLKDSVQGSTVSADESDMSSGDMEQKNATNFKLKDSKFHLYATMCSLMPNKPELRSKLIRYMKRGRVSNDWKHYVLWYWTVYI